VQLDLAAEQRGGGQAAGIADRQRAFVETCFYRGVQSTTVYLQLYNAAAMALSNELLWIGYLLLDMCMVVLVYRLFGREGLTGYLVFALLACNIQVLKLVQLFGLNVTLGTILYGSIFLTTDILTELHGKQAAQRAIWIGFVTMVMMALFMQICIVIAPAPFDRAQPHFAALFSFLPRIAVGSLAAYLLSQFLDVTLFVRIRQATGGRWLWLRNNGSTMLSQALDTLMFFTIGLAPLPILGSVPGFENWANWVQVVAAVDTPFIYWARSIGQRHHRAETYDWSAEQLAHAAVNG
jgi:uncharacterized integral membrane protein (TIGR00697 family)